MSNKIALLLFTASVLLTSFAALVIPQANALNNSGIDNSHVTARFNSHLKICGDHKCASGEQTQWEKTVMQSQMVRHGKVGQAAHGGDVMHKLVGTTSGQTMGNTSVKMAENVKMSGNATKSTNMTGNVPKGTK